MRTVLVLPFVPVSASQGAGSPLNVARSRQASSTSPMIGMPAASASASNGAVGRHPGEVMTSWVPSGNRPGSPSRTNAPRRSSSAARARTSSPSPVSTIVTVASRASSARATDPPETPMPATQTGAPTHWSTGPVLTRPLARSVMMGPRSRLLVPSHRRALCSRSRSLPPPLRRRPPSRSADSSVRAGAPGCSREDSAARRRETHAATHCA